MVSQMQVYRSIKSIPLIGLLLALFSGMLLGLWLYYTPPGVFGKADAVGYAFCHRIPERSYFFFDRQSPLCARCSGMYLGAFVAFAYQLKYRRKGGMPSRIIMAAFGFFLLAFAADGLNSYFQLWPILQPIYHTENWMRLLSGTGLGLAIAGVLYPLVNQSLWNDYTDERVLHSWSQLVILVILALLVDLLMLSGSSVVLSVLGLLSSLTVFSILVMIYTIVWTMVLKKENTFRNWNQASFVLLAGLASALFQVLIMDFGRYFLTGTWVGIIPS
jgi:uncharacterized membrane protein